MNAKVKPKLVPPVATVVLTETVSRQVDKLNADVLRSLGVINALIDNRSAWVDAIEGCREAVALLRNMQGSLVDLLIDVAGMETNLATARNEINTWDKMHTELLSVERTLRTEHTQLTHEHAELLANAQEQTVKLEKCEALLKKQGVSLRNVRALAGEIARELTGEST